MVTFTHKICDPNGLHAKSAAYLAQFGAGCQCRIRVSCKDSAADIRQLMGLMGLRAKRGDILEFKVEGEGEEAAAGELRVLVAKVL